MGEEEKGGEEDELGFTQGKMGQRRRQVRLLLPV
jgi:hypothetical protein